MSKSLENVMALGPFEDAIVSSPREVEPAVQGLNEDALKRVLHTFERLRRQTPPHPPIKAPRAQRIFSPAPGYGKSHLLGRLFQRVGSHATRVYVHPFEEPSCAWSSLLRTTIQELTKPESGDAVSRLPGAPDQLDAIAHGIFGQGLAATIRAGEANVEGMPHAERILSEGVSSRWDLSNPELPLTSAFAEVIDALIPILEKRMNELAVSLSHHWSSPAAWLRLLFCYAGARNRDPALREQCLTWFRANAYQEEDFSALGLEQRDLLPPSLPSGELESASRSRLYDLCQLASLSRPFLFCFDQTETYRRDASLAWAFGHLICTLVNEAVNQISVVTANHLVWEKCIEPHFEEAHKARFDTVIPMEGITRSQGDAIIHARLAYLDVSEQDIRRLQKAVKQSNGSTAGNNAQTSVRRFIQDCHEVLHEIVGNNKDGGSAAAEQTLDALFRKEYQQWQHQSTTLSEYNSELFRWALRYGVGAEQASISPDYYPLVYTPQSGKPILFGLEDGNNHNRWRARLNEARRRHRQEGAIAIHLRLENQKPIPGNWQSQDEFREARDFFRIHILSEQRLVEIHALWRLYSKSCQQDIEFNEDEVIKFVADILEPWKEELVGED